MKNFIKITFLSLVIASPLVLLAAAPVAIDCSIKNFAGVVTCAGGLMGAAIYLLMSFALVYTVYGAVRFIGAEGSDREKWREVIIHGIIGLFVITSIWGLVRILTGTFNFQNSPIAPPAFNSTL